MGMLNVLLRLSLIGCTSSVEEDGAYGRECLAIAASAQTYAFVELLPLPRTLVLCLFFRLIKKRQLAFDDADHYDPYAGKVATFSDFTTAVLHLWLVYPIIDGALLYWFMSIA